MVFAIGRMLNQGKVKTGQQPYIIKQYTIQYSFMLHCNYTGVLRAMDRIQNQFFYKKDWNP